MTPAQRRDAAEAELARANAAATSARHCHATSQTLYHRDQRQRGALARAYEAGQISLDQLAWSQEILAVYARIAAGVAVGTMSLETRVDQSRGGGFYEALGAVWAEMAYARWRGALKRPGPVLWMITEDRSPRAARDAWRMREVTARKLLTDALDLWPDCFAEAQKRFDADDLLALHQRLS